MINPLNLSNKNILVTGASSGIGRETSILLSQLGANVILVARRESELLKTLDLMENKSQHLVEPFDLTNFEDISAWIREIAKKTQGLHGLVHCAGVQITKPVRFIGVADINNLFSININAALGLAKIFCQKNIYLPNSSIVFLASAAGFIGNSGLSVYSASKGAVIALTKSLAMEFVRNTIRVNCIAPGLVKTEMFEKWVLTLTEEQKLKNLDQYPLGIGTPRDIANAVVFLLSDAARWITGTTLVVDGGYTAQ